MSTSYNYFRRRRLGRAASPPTWACYEQIHQYDSDSYDSSEDESGSECSFDSSSDNQGRNVAGSSSKPPPPGRESCSEDEEDYHRPPTTTTTTTTTMPSGGSAEPAAPQVGGIGTEDIDMDMGGDSDTSSRRGRAATRDIKGKGKAVEPVEDVVVPQNSDGGEAERRRERRERRKRNKTRREVVYPLRPILTIHKSQGFVWNQDLFVPPYIKDRYIASTSPPNSKGFISTSASSTNTAMSSNEYEAVEVVEIRIREGEFRGIIPC